MTTSQRDAESWFRSRGLPLFVTPRARGALLIARAMPFLVLAAAVDVASWWLDTTTVSLDETDPLFGLATLMLSGVLGLGLVGAPAAALGFGGRLVRVAPRAAMVGGCGVAAVYVFGVPWLPGHPLASAAGAAAQNACIVAAALLLTWIGAGSLVSWALRTAVRQLGALGRLATRALPLLMLVVVVSFFSRALWEVTNAMSAAQLAGVVAFFALLGLFFIVPVTRREMSGLEAMPALTRFEHLNVTTVLVLAQGLQVAVFSLLVCLFLTVLGQIAVSVSVLDAWLGPHRAPLELAGIRMPVDAALVKTAVFLSCVSSLNFLVSATTTASYRSAFYDPLFDDARQALAVRAVYHAEAAHSPR